MRRLAQALALGGTTAALAAGAAALAPSAGAVTFGSDLTQAANVGFGCEARPYPGFGGGMQLNPTGAATCMWWSAPLTRAATYAPFGQGTVTAARVRSGANPAPLRISIISSGGGLCCTQQRTSAPFQPTPNAVTTVALNLAAGSGLDPNRPGSQYSDVVVVSAVGPGTLPVHDYGVHGTFDTSVPAASFLHPELTDGNSNTDVGWMDGFEVLLQVDWSATPAPPPAVPGPTPPVTPTPGPTAPTPTPNPPAARPAPVLRRLGLDGRTLTLRTAGGTAVTARLRRCTLQGRARRLVCAVRAVATLRASADAAGAVRLALPSGLAAGVYRVTATARGGARALVKTFTVKPAARRRAASRRR